MKNKEQTILKDIKLTVFHLFHVNGQFTAILKEIYGTGHGSSHLKSECSETG